MKMAENKTCDSCRRCSGVLLNTFISLTSTFGFKNLCFQGFESKFCRNPNINSKDMTNLNKWMMTYFWRPIPEVSVPPVPSTESQWAASAGISLIKSKQYTCESYTFCSAGQSSWIKTTLKVFNIRFLEHTAAPLHGRFPTGFHSTTCWRPTSFQTQVKASKLSRRLSTDIFYSVGQIVYVSSACGNHRASNQKPI